MTSPDAVPQRLSHAEREAAVAALRAHFDAGRLDADEFAERSADARTARTASDVVGLFGDLPVPHPTFVQASQPTWNTYPSASSARPGYPGSPPTTPPGTTSPASATYPPVTAPEPGSPADYQNYAARDQQVPTYSGTVVPYTQGPPPSRRDNWLGIVHAVIWPVAIVLLITGHGGFWIIIAAIIASSALGKYQRNQRRRRQPPPY